MSRHASRKTPAASAESGDASAAAKPPSPRQAMLRFGRVAAGPVGGFALGVAMVATWMLWGDRPATGTALSADAPAASAPPSGADARLADAVQRANAALGAAARLERSQAEERARATDRLAAIEGAIGRLETSAARSEEMSRRALETEGRRAAQQERFILAMLHLQAAIGSARPWLREYQAAANLAPPDSLPRPLAEVLASHAARGLATEADLRERFVALAPTLVARAPQAAGVAERAGAALRSAFATIGLAAPPAPSDVDAGVQRIQEQLRRGNLAAAVSDATTLDARVQPLIAGWLAQVRARLAVEQAVQETLLRAIAGNGHRPT